jgi:flagellar biosynthesis/type III secretory pathway chaperone
MTMPQPSEADTEILTAGAGALSEALDAEHNIYTSMLDLTHREEDAILAGDVAALTHLTEEKEALIEHLHALETERMTAIMAIAAATGLNPDEATLSQIAEQLPALAAAELTGRGVELRARAVSLQQANDRNAAMLRSSRDLIDRWIHYLRTVVTGSLYTAGGIPADGALARRSLDRSA